MEPPRPPETEDLPVLPGYDIIEALEESSPGRAYRVSHRLMQQERIVKIIPADWLHPAQGEENVLRELRAGAQLRHHGILKVYDAWLHNRMIHIVMEYFPGARLSHWYAGRATATETEAARIAWQLADALVHAHENGVLHRDLNPRNVLMDETLHVKIADFGLQRAAVAAASGRDADEISTYPACMAPERLHHASAVGRAADLYGLGTNLFFCLVGRAPRTGVTVGEIANSLDRPLRDIREWRPGLSKTLETILNRLLAPDPARRFAHAAEARDALSPWLGDAPPTEEDTAKIATFRSALQRSTMMIAASIVKTIRHRSDDDDDPAALDTDTAASHARLVSTPPAARTSSFRINDWPVTPGDLPPPLPIERVPAVSHREPETVDLDFRPRPRAPTESASDLVAPPGTAMLFPALPHLRAYAPMHGWMEHELVTGRIRLIGRLPDSDFCLPDGSISRRHAQVILDDQRCLTVRDDQSSYGVLIRGQRRSEAQLRNGESFQLGCFMVEFDDGAAPSDPALTPWRERGFRPLPSGMLLEWNPSGHANTPIVPEPPVVDAYPGGLLALAREELPAGGNGQAVLTWPDGTRFVMPGKVLETVSTRRGRLTAFRLYRPSF